MTGLRNTHCFKEARHRGILSQGPNRPILSYLTPQVEARFWALVACGEDDACWDWKGSLSHNSYGRFKVGGHEARQANRVAWTIANRRDPGSLIVRHRCDRPKCCNPAHLEIGTHQDNSDDKTARGRNASRSQRGVLNAHARLTEAQIGEIVAAIRAGEQNMTIAYRYPVGDSLISRIRTGRSWQREAALFGWPDKPPSPAPSSAPALGGAA